MGGFVMKLLYYYETRYVSTLEAFIEAINDPSVYGHVCMVVETEHDMNCENLVMLFGEGDEDPQVIEDYPHEAKVVLANPCVYVLGTIDAVRTYTLQY